MTSKAESPKVEFDRRDPAVVSLASAVPLTFVRDSSGSVKSTYSGVTVYVDRQSDVSIQPGETYFVRLKDKRIESNCYFAIPIEKVGAEFFLEMSVPDRFEFLKRIFMKGGKPSIELANALMKCSPELCETLTKSGMLLQMNCEMNNVAAMYKQKLDNANATIRQKDADIAKLREKLAQKSVKPNREEVEVLRKALTESEAKVAEMEGVRKSMEEQVSELGRTISDMASAGESEKKELEAKLEESRKSLAVALEERDSALKSKAEEMEGKERLIDALSRKLAEFRRTAVHPEASLPAYMQVFRPGVTVRRDSEHTISSDWFVADRYRVLMSGDMKRIRIAPDENGGVECSNYTLTIPKLESVSRFTSVTYLKAEFAPDMSSVEVVL